MGKETDIPRVLLDEHQVRGRIAEMGAKISQDYSQKDLALIAMLKGSFVFAADLIRSLTIPVTIDMMATSRYESQAGSGVVRITKDLEDSISGRDVLLVEDIIDSGLTASYLLRILRQRNPASLEICALLDKSARRIIDLPIAYRGFDIPDVFVVGYGMDYQQKYRNLPYIGIMRNAYKP